MARGASPSNIRVVSIVCAPPALKVLGEKFPGLKIYTGRAEHSGNGGASDVAACTPAGVELAAGACMTAWAAGQHRLQRCLWELLLLLLTAGCPLPSCPCRPEQALLTLS